MYKMLSVRCSRNKIIKSKKPEKKFDLNKIDLYTTEKAKNFKIFIRLDIN
jgi:hypothetical protein